MKFNKNLEITDEEYVEEVAPKAEVEAKPEPEPIKEREVEVEATCDVYVRAEASPQGKKVEVVRKGEKRKVKGEVNEWYKFENGYSMKKFYK